MADRLLRYVTVLLAALAMAPCLAFQGQAVSVTKALTAARPPRGAVYTRTLRLPVLGKQEMWLRIDTRSTATLRLHGPLCLDDTVRYAVEDGELVFKLGVRTRALLQRVRTSIKAVRYDPLSDTATVTVHPPLPTPVVVRMSREESKK